MTERSFSRGAVLFDLDGTLIDSAPGITAAINATLLGLGEPQVPPADLRDAIGPPLQETFGRLLAHRDPSPDELDGYVEEYRRIYRPTMVTGSTVYPGIPELLAMLEATGRPLAIATSKARHLAEQLADGLGFRRHFTAVLGPVPPAADPKAETIRQALEALGPAALADGAVMIGDRHHDIGGARANGLPSIGVLYGFGDRDELLAAGADALAEGTAELGRLLGI